MSSTSRYELVPPPAPNTVARPTTLGACQVRLQLSMQLLPSATLANFCAAKLTSLVAFEQLKIPNVVGPQDAMAAWKTFKQVPSCAHGSGCSQGFLGAANSALGAFSTKQDVAALQTAMAAAAARLFRGMG